MAIFGLTHRFGVGKYCPLLIKLDKGGNIVLSNSYSRGTGFEALCIAANGFSGFYFSGVENGNAVICKVDSIGKLIWSKKINTKTGYIRPKMIIPESSKEFWAVYDYTDINVLYGAMICKFDSAGNVLLKLLIKPSQYLKNIDLNGAVSYNQKIIVCGSTSAFGNYQNLMFSMDKTGNIDWVKTYDYKDSASGLYNPILASDGNVSIVGYSNQNASISAGTLLKIDPQGNIKWAKRYKDSSSVRFTSHVQ